MKNYFKINKVFLFIFSIMIISFSGVNIKNTVLALTGDYNRAVSGDNEINVNDWDDLDMDFLATDGSNTMTSGANIVFSGGGNVTGLPNPPINNNDATSKAYVDSIVGGSANITNTNGENLKMICGRTPPGATNWINGSPTWYVDVDISAANFTEGTIPYIFTSLGGLDKNWYTGGVQNILSTNVGTLDNLDDEFRVYIYDFNGISFGTMLTYGWYVNWCDIGK